MHSPDIQEIKQWTDELTEMKGLDFSIKQKVRSSATRGRIKRVTESQGKGWGNSHGRM